MLQNKIVYIFFNISRYVISIYLCGCKLKIPELKTGDSVGT